MSKFTYNIMSDQDYKKSVRKLAIPSIATFLVLSMYLTVDRILMAKYVSPNVLGAIQFVMPTYNIIVAIAAFVALGVKSRYSILLGKKDQYESDRIVSIGLVLITIAGLTSIFLLYNAATFIPKLLNANSQLLQYSKEYFKILSFTMLANAYIVFYDGLLRAKGYKKSLVISAIISHTINISLDIHFMSNLKMGIEGAAWASVIAIHIQLILVILILLYHHQDKFIPRFWKHSLFKAKEIYKVISRVGSPAFVASTSFALRSSFLTYLVAKFGTSGDLTGFSAAMIIVPVMFIPINGLFTATSPILGFSLGQKNLQRLHDVTMYKMKLLKRYLVMIAFLVWIMPRPILSIFGIQEMENAVFTLRVMISGLWYLAVPYSWANLFQSMELPWLVIYPGLIRNNIFYWPVTFLAAIIFKDVKIIILSSVFSDFLTYIYIKPYVGRWIKKHKAKDLHYAMTGKKLQS